MKLLFSWKKIKNLKILFIPFLFTNLITSCGIGSYCAICGAVVVPSLIYKKSNNFFQKCIVGQDEKNRYTLDDKNIIESLSKENISIKTVDIDKKLHGYIYTSTSKILSGDFKNNSLRNKTIIFYSGSGSSNISQISNIAKFYTSRGATVVGFDYRGFGKSKYIRKVTEKSIGKDASRIYDYVKDKVENQSENIIIHGLSLGGYTAAKEAKKISKRDKNLGGLILQNPIKNTKNTIFNLNDRSLFTRCLMVTGAFFFADNFNCVNEMQKLFKYNPNLPICICEGENNDNLSLQTTKMDELIKNLGFKNLTIHKEDKLHSSILSDNLVRTS